MLPGPFVLEFWRSLVIPASSSELSVFHALLSLSAVHWRGHWDGYGQIAAIGVRDEQERFMLKHYVQAMSELRSQLSSADRTTIRVVLISCLLLICLEMLRGYFGTAQVHFDRGLPLARNLGRIQEQDGNIGSRAATLESTDQHILQAFARLQLHIELFRSSYPHDCTLLSHPMPTMRRSVFDSGSEAWDHLEYLLHECISLTQESYKGPIPALAHTDVCAALLERQSLLQAMLDKWENKLHASKGNLSTKGFKGDMDEDFVLHYFLAWHSMVSIMAAVCRNGWDASAYDGLTDNFACILEHCTAMHEARSKTHRIQALPGYLIDMSRSIVNVGWLPPLYFTALRCSSQEIKLQAIDLIQTVSHREGIWDSKICAKVAQTLLEMTANVRKVRVDLGDDVRAGIRVAYTDEADDHWHETWVVI